MSTASPRYYNPDWQDDDSLLTHFIARQAEFSLLRDALARAPREGTVQHHLLIGLRGAGKTTLLKRLAVAIRRDADLGHLIALSFPEELYQVKTLSDFWWAACEALVDELDRLNQPAQADVLDARIAARDTRDDPLSLSGLECLQQTCGQLQRRPVLLVDNLDFLLERIDKDGRKRKNPLSPAYWSLREALSTAQAPLVIGASVRLSEPFTDYDKAFYDFFLPRRLGRLSRAEVQQVLEHLAEVNQTPEVRTRLHQRPARIDALYELTGGNPRAIGFIFELLRRGLGQRAVEDFESLMDLTTPYYKARFEDLSEQAQVIMHALAVRRPGNGSQLRFGHTAAQIGEHCGLPTGSVSAQLDGLEREGLVEKSAAHGRTQYRIAEQLFRLWLQMRANRRIRQNVLWLTEFLEAVFEADELQAWLADNLSEMNAWMRACFSFAAAGTGQAAGQRHGLEAHATDDLLQHVQQHGGCMADHLAEGDLPPELAELARLRERLQQHQGGGLSAEEQDALLGSLRIKADEKTSWVNELCDPNKAAAARQVLREQFTRERSVLKDLGLREEEITLWFRLCARGYFPLGWRLTPALVDGACVPPFAPAAVRALAVHVVQCLPVLVDPSDDAAMAAWERWLDEHGLKYGIQSFTEDIRHRWLAGEYCVQGSKLEKAQDWQAAETAFRRAVELNPEYLLGWFGLGSMLKRTLERRDEAEAIYREAVASVPGSPTARIMLAVFVLQQGDLSKGEEITREALQRHPDDAKLQELSRVIQGAKARLSAMAQLRQGLSSGDRAAAQTALRQLLESTDPEDLASTLGGNYFVEDFLAPLLPDKDRARDMLQLLRELGYDRHARPLLLAFEAAIEGRPDRVEELEPEIREATRRLLARLTGQGAAHP